MNTGWLPKSSSASIKRLRQVNWPAITGLVGLGLVIAIAQAYVHLPLRLPGWRGLLWLTPLVVTRLLTNRLGAASITSLSGAGFSLLLGVRNEPYDWFFYLVVGELLDIAYHWGRRWRKQIWFWSVVVGLVHLTKPLVRMFIGASGIGSYGFLFAGPIYPLLTHFLFGAIAGLVGSLVVLWVKRWRRD